MEHVKLSAVILVALVACAGPRTTPTSSADHPVTTTPSPAANDTRSHGVLAPLAVSWISVQTSDTRAILRARVERRSQLALPLSLSVTVPPGVRIVRGASSVVVANDAQHPTTEYEYEFAYDRTPDGDILLSVDGDTDSMGVHNRAWYRFGRAEPQAPQTERSGPPLVIGGRNFGSSVSGVPK